MDEIQLLSCSISIHICMYRVEEKDNIADV